MRKKKNRYVAYSPKGEKIAEGKTVAAVSGSGSRILVDRKTRKAAIVDFDPPWRVAWHSKSSIVRGMK